MTEPMIYQHDYSKLKPELYDAASRELKAKKIVAVLADHLGQGELGKKTLLDVGCSSGIITHYLGEHFGSTCGVDIDASAIAFATEKFGNERVRFEKSDGLGLHFPEASFDVVVCSQVYEHVPDSTLLMQEIYRLLKPGGVCYFSAGNRLALMEPHYHLPFLSILPKRAAHLYLRALGRGDHYYETHLTLWGLRRLTSRFRVIDYTEKVLREPRKFHMEDTLREGSLLHRVLPPAIHALYWACPNYIWLLVK